MKIHRVGIRQFVIRIKLRLTDKARIVTDDIILVRVKATLNITQNFVGVVHTNYGVCNVNDSPISINPAAGIRGCISRNRTVGDRKGSRRIVNPAAVVGSGIS